MTPQDQWLYTISSKHKLIDLNFKEIWRYRDLLILFVKRDIVTVYKQTILGPLWYVIQPLFTSVIFTLIFNNLGQISTNGVPPFLFNLAGITAWNYFRECLTGTSSTFTSNQGIFGKVYFPRVIMPMSITISNLLKFGIQLGIFIGFYVYYAFQGSTLGFNSHIVLLPVYIIMMALLGLGLGMIISSMTTKYRDLTILVSFGVQLLMYVSAVPYPVSEAKAKFPEMVALLVEYNPLTQIIEGFRYMLLNTGTFSWFGFGYTLIISIVLFLVGLVIFNKTEKTFIDTV
ncbi:lipopolysaccharide transport system permease protein [Gelidibacter algens]|jgi:lipopolysaccharide transport system permease protein|uniref:Transport permease protein n=1 Tax=Gelidibacter algens TaxID=49280 RepID=A0A1A7R385_9FLAO|nr:ABC transporter permease [Gelidibacter algens]OBX21225.1 ABC transporter permease [Gelidibacter algens]OBX25963.1 ABC transporter permease [Gelidibacter algens]RAJ25233.1 lipopolysaccharide transport system permease protein [Gelidibacter algens]